MPKRNRNSRSGFVGRRGRKAVPAVRALRQQFAVSGAQAVAAERPSRPQRPAMAMALGGLSERVPPVPIPNTAVKPLSPDGTARASVWESRTPPN